MKEKMKIEDMVESVKRNFLYELFIYDGDKKLGLTEQAEIVCEEARSKDFEDDACNILYAAIKLMIWTQRNSKFEDITCEDWFKNLISDYLIALMDYIWF